jgi:hypothetical protein|tara:strand:+ start:5472 stop:6107 length:636 start_codon:yes stop_codon:yes gene_type:complete
MNSTSTENDAYQQMLVARASRWAETFVGYPLLAQTYTETLAGYSSMNLMLARTPLRVILRMFDSTSTASATEYCSTNFRVEDSDAGFLSRDQGWAWTAGVRYYLERTIVPNSELKPWMVSYTAGYVGPTGQDNASPVWSTCGGLPNSTSTDSTVPKDIEQAVLLKAAEWARGNPAGIASEGIADLTVSYMTSGNYRSEAEDLLRPYQSVTH